MTARTRCELCDREFKDREGLAMHTQAKHPQLILPMKKHLPTGKIVGWTICIVVIGLMGWGVFVFVGSLGERTVIDESRLNFEAPKGEIHWHPALTIKIDGKEVPIPANIGIGGAHFPIHTHTEDAAAGVIHMENKRPTKKTVTLGYFFQVWGKKFSKDCIFEYCTDKGALRMMVNGKENTEFENYFMQDKDTIVIEYVSS